MHKILVAMKLKKLILSLTLPAIFVVTATAQQLAFPGAQGWGRFAQGARAAAQPTVYHVTNLLDSGSGSLRDAVLVGGRIVVFDVSGIIRLSSRLSFANNLYVAGQTAPGEGITVYGDGVTFSSADNIICRYLRVRMGHGGTSGKDCAGVAHGTNMIFDHCSFSWGLDETFSINSDGKGALGDITIQNCIIGQGLMTHSAGGLIQGDHLSIIGNFYCDNSTRNNKVKGTNQFANNIVYNWKNGAYIMGGDSEGKSYVNIESNLFVNGPDGDGSAFTGANADFHCYGNDNWQDRNADGQLNASVITDYSASTREAIPYDYPALELWKGNELLEKSLPTVGASLPYRDQADCYMVDEVLSLGKQGALITYESALPIGTPSDWSWWKGEKIIDTDKDGMPDWWEEANGTDPAKNDACRKAANGYLNIENYLNSITASDRQFFLRQPITVVQQGSTTSTLTIGWRDYTYEEEGFCIEVEKDGAWTEMGRTKANATRYVVSELQPGTSYNIRVRAFAKQGGEEVFSSYSNTAVMTTRPLDAGIVDIDNYQPDNTLGAQQTEINLSTTAWAEGKALQTAGNVLLNTDKEVTVTLTENIEPATVVVNGTGHLTLEGEGKINGETTSLNKGNTGTLTLNTKHGYKGATVNHEGIVELKYLANGGAASSVGASQSFAQNWIFDGGTFAYTGITTSTDRSARIDRASTFAITKAATTVTAKGVFEGKGQLTIDGEGALSIANANFFGYEGATRLKGGKVMLTDIENACKALGSSGKQFIMAGGTLQFASKNEDFQNLNFPIQVEDGTTSIIAMPTHCYFRSPITGNGTLQFNIPYLRSYLRPDFSKFTGKIIGNGTNSSGASLFFSETQWNAPNVRFELKGNAYMAAWTTNAVNVIGGLSGDAGTYLVGSSKQSDGWKCSWEVGGANSDETFRGIINNLPAGLNAGHSGTVSIKKVGTGIWRLMGKNEYSGTTTVSAGTLIVNGTHSGTGLVSVAKDATLKGKGTIAGKVTLSSGGIICPGDTMVNLSVLKLTGGLSLQKGSRMQIPLKEKEDGTLTSNLVRVAGALSITSGAVLELDMSRISNHVFQEGEVVSVFSTPSSMTGNTGQFSSIEPATPAEGLMWDTSTLFSDGKLRVKTDPETDDVQNTVFAPDGTSISYDMNGRLVSPFVISKGLYIVGGRKVIK